MTEAQRELTDRLRAVLSGEAALREVSMFGGRAFMVDGKLLVSAGRDGGLLVRVGPKRYDDLLGRPGASVAVMGQRREMSPGWIAVGAEAIESDEALTFWIDAALEHHRSGA